MKDKKRKGRKPSKTRAFVCAFLFLLGTIFLIALIVLPFFYEAVRLYFIIPISIIYLLNVVLAVFIFNSKVQTNFKLSWLVVVIVLPFVGAIIYLIFAKKFTTKRMKRVRFDKVKVQLIKGKIDSFEVLEELKDVNLDAYCMSNYLYQYDDAGITKNNYVEYFPLGEDGFPRILEELKKAQRFIFIEYFIIEEGHMFGSIYDILKEKAQEGIEVKIIYDDFGSLGKLHYNFAKTAEKDGISVIPFNRIRPTVDIRQNSRDHRKFIIIDGITAFTGGCNLADEYINLKTRFGKWKDNFVMVKGPDASSSTNLFLSNWSLLTKKYLSSEELQKYNFETNKDLLDEEINNPGYVQSYGETPFNGEDTAKNIYLQMINRAKKYIYISTPYLILDDEMVLGLSNAAKSGVDVRIVTPGIPDKKVVYSITRSYYSRLMIHGVKIYEYTPGFNHTKMIVVDDIFAITGTINFDFRSLYLHYENAVYFFNVPAIMNMKKDMEEMFDGSEKQLLEVYVNKPLIQRQWWGILRIIATLL